MLSRNMLPVWIGIMLSSGMFLMGQNHTEQANLCDPDPCGGIPNAVPDTCTQIPGGWFPDDFACQCSSGFTWQQPTHTCRSDMAQIPEGCFDMGDSSDGCAESDECPVHNVCISAFEMDVHEVTNAQYAECVAAGGCTFYIDWGSATRLSYYGNPAYHDFPVIYVDWFEATGYCTWAGKRLPTEAEWEYAARGGLTHKRYPWGDTISGADANYSDSGDPWDNDTSPVEYYAPNGYGLYDVAGNVWEWVEDDYHSSYVGAPADGSAWVDFPPGVYRVLRGGSYYVSPYDLRVADRYDFNPDYKNSGVGFRCARGGAYGP